jgi:hypothetical protein
MYGTRLGRAVRALASWRAAASDESGQMLIFAVVLFTVLLVIGALAIDAGLAFSEKDGLQNATDAAALAGARNMPDTAAAKTAACDYMSRNGYSNSCILVTGGTSAAACPSGTNCVDIPPTQGAHAGTAGYVEVIANGQSEAGFINLFASIGPFRPSARSVTGYIAGGSVSAGVYAYVTNPDTTCSPAKTNQPGKDVEFSGSTTTIVGDLRSNGSIYAGALAMSGGSITFGCQIGPLNTCHPVCDPAVQDPNSSSYPPPIALSGSSGSFYNSTMRNTCSTHPAGVYVMSSGDLSTAHDQNNVVHFHLGNSNQRHSLDPGIYCFNGAITIPAKSCAMALAPSQITAISVANPTVITTASAHGFVTGDQIWISGSNSTPSVNGMWNVTVLSVTRFTIPVRVTTAGTTGNAYNACPGTAGTLPTQGNGITFVALGPNGNVSGGGSCGGGHCSNLIAYNSATLDPDNVLIYGEGTGTSQPGAGTNGGRDQFTGILAVPNGMINNGNGSGLHEFWGAWLANTIKLTGAANNPIIHASGIGQGPAGLPVVTLVE